MIIFFSVIIIVLKCVPCVYRISTDVRTLSEHSNIDNIRWWVIYMYLLRILYLFASRLLLCFFMITFCFMVIIIVLNISVTCIDRILHNSTTYHQQQHQRVGTIYIYIVYFMFYPASVLLFTLLYDNISYNFFISHYYL